MMQGIENLDKRVLLEYGNGCALLGTVRCADPSASDDAVKGSGRAQAIARLQDPELTEMITRTLMHMQLIANLIEERKALWRDINRRARALHGSGAADYDQDPMASEDAMLFERMLELCQKISQLRKGEVWSM
jgi:hypothetical protein